MMNFKINASLLPICLAAILAGCGGSGSGQQNQQNTPPDNDNQDQGLVYSGPSAATDDVLQFKLNIWDNLASEDRCGSCHNEEVGQEPLFLRRDDINLAYEATLPLVNKATPVTSRLVERAEAGHNIWDPSAADTIQNLIQRWATATGAAQTSVPLIPPSSRVEIGNSRQFLIDSAAAEPLAETINAYANTIGALVRDTSAANCVSCHSPSSNLRQQPFFADADPASAFDAARTLIDLANPDNSRFIRRMEEGHNVWGDPGGVLGPVPYSVQQMRQAVNAFIDAGTAVLEIDENLLASDAMSVSHPEVVIASGGGRIETDVIALYQFKQGEGSVAFDTSGVEPAAQLNLSPEVEWVGSWGLRFEDNAKAQASTLDSAKLHRLIQLTGEYTVEAWVVPANVTQEESRIVTYSGGTNSRNFSLNQTLYNYEFFARNSSSDANGAPRLNTPSADEILQATLQHVVATYDPLEGRRIYVNGTLVAEEGEAGGDINDWDETFVLAIGNEVDNARPWNGTMRLLAIHNRVLTPEQVQFNFEAGVGQKFFLMFGVSHLVDMPQAYIVFTVEVFDDYSYLFDSPFFISVEDGAVPTSDIRIEGMRIGINGQEASISQAFANIDVTITPDNYDAEAGVPLATNPSGTLIGMQNGPEDDLFFLTFDSIGGVDYDRPTEEAVPPPSVELSDAKPRLGIKTYDEIFQTLSALTGVPAQQVYDFFDNPDSGVRRSLPAAPEGLGFLPSQQSAITQLALEYCKELIETPALSQAFFGSPGYGDLNSQAEIDALVDPLLRVMLIDNPNLMVEQPQVDDIRLRLDNEGTVPLPVNYTPADIPGLIQTMTSSADDTATAVCTSVLASAVMLMQ